MDCLEEIFKDPKKKKAIESLSRPIHVSSFVEFANEMADEELVQEFEVVDRVSSSPQPRPFPDAFNREDFYRKNRYADVLPNSKYRVVLDTSDPKDFLASYINASWIYATDEKGPHRYIATQAPLPTSQDDFWRMVVERRVNVIVMLVKERRAKSAQKVGGAAAYWPDQPGVTQQFGATATGVPIMVTCESPVSPCAGVLERRVTVTVGDDSRVLYHVQYVAWPDGGVPAELSSFSAFLLRYRAMCRLYNQSAAPVVVHCSAGIGRTGTFILVDCLMNQCPKLFGQDQKQAEEVKTTSASASASVSNPASPGLVAAATTSAASSSSSPADVDAATGASSGSDSAASLESVTGIGSGGAAGDDDDDDAGDKNGSVDVGVEAPVVLEVDDVMWDIPQAVIAMRMMRPGSVQTQDQYVFAYRALADLIEQQLLAMVPSSQSQTASSIE